MQNQRSLTNFFPDNKITQNEKVSVLEVNYSNDNALVPDKYFIYHNLKCQIFHYRLLKPSTIAIHRRNGHKNTLSFRNLIASATDYLSYLISFSNCDDTITNYIMVKYEDTNLTYGTEKSISGTDIDSETT